jgi:hypothetical protein
MVPPVNQVSNRLTARGGAANHQCECQTRNEQSASHAGVPAGPHSRAPGPRPSRDIAISDSCRRGGDAEDRGQRNRILSSVVSMGRGPRPSRSGSR